MSFRTVIFLVSFLLLSSIFLSTADSEVEDEPPFNYDEVSEKGPSKWGELDPEWKACGDGRMQSPIDLFDSRELLHPYLGKLQRDYKPAPAVLRNRGHDIVLRWNGDAGEIRINGTEYKLVQCHWHSPSEHTVNGSRYDLELHIVHTSPEGGTAVIGILYKYGRCDPLLSRVFHDIGDIDKEEKDLGIFNPGHIKFDGRKYYRYVGSLTVPPCTEGVIWTISKEVRTVSREQTKALRDAVHDGFEKNARPIQPLNGRDVYIYHPSNSGGMQEFESGDFEEEIEHFLNE